MLISYIFFLHFIRSTGVSKDGSCQVGRCNQVSECLTDTRTEKKTWNFRCVLQIVGRESRQRGIKSKITYPLHLCFACLAKLNYRKRKATRVNEGILHLFDVAAKGHKNNQTSIFTKLFAKHSCLQYADNNNANKKYLLKTQQRCNTTWSVISSLKVHSAALNDRGASGGCIS